MADYTINKRARLGPAFGALDSVLGGLRDCDSLLQPLRKTSGIIFPYTPTLMFGGMANYGQFHFTHSNYPYNQYQNSAPQEIQLTTEFTAQTNEEARYLLATLTFLRASTMMEFGVEAAKRGVAGTPPPVLRFNYMGGHMFNNIPVVVTNFSYVLQDDVDYVKVKLPGSLDATVSVDLYAPEGEDIFTIDDHPTYMPTWMSMTTTLAVQQNPHNVKNNYDLEKFKRGDLINKGFI